MDLNNKNQACAILEINHNYTSDELKQAYRRMALKYHPDKCGDISGDKFKEINDAYHFLSQEEEHNDDEDENETYRTYNKYGTYDSILLNFINFFNKNIDVKMLVTFIHNIAKKGSDFSLKFLRECDRDVYINIYEFIIKYKDVFHLTPELMEQLSSIAREKTINENIIITNPSLKDLFEANIFKLDYNNQLFYIPLWHSEIHYDTSRNVDLIVKCIPDLPEHITIDEYNNIHIHLTHKTTISELFTTEFIYYKLFDDKELSINIRKLYIQKKQSVKFLNCGIPKISTSNIYDVGTKKGDIIIHLELEY